MRRINIIIFSLLTLSFVGCKEEESKLKQVKEIKVYQISYQWRAAECDSVITLKEHTWFDKDSNITKHINHLNGYYYEVVRDKATRTVKESHYTLDSVLMYRSIAELDSLGRQVRADYYSNEDHLYAIVTDYLDDSEVIKKQSFTYPGQTPRHLVYNYDKNNNIIQQYSIRGSDTTLIEDHKLEYDHEGRILSDLILYTQNNSILTKWYDGGKLTKQTRFNILDSDNKQVRSYNLEDYFYYNADGNIIDMRRKRFYPSDGSIEKENRTLISWLDKNLIKRRTVYNPRARKTSALRYEYTFWE